MMIMMMMVMSMAMMAVVAMKVRVAEEANACEGRRRLESSASVKFSAAAKESREALSQACARGICGRSRSCPHQSMHGHLEKGCADLRVRVSVCAPPAFPHDSQPLSLISFCSQERAWFREEEEEEEEEEL
jgi:hypothetical protein